jgi:hypothetical protein
LTNNAIQKYSTNYGMFEDGNQIGFDKFFNYLKSIGHPDVREKIIERMKELVLISMKSAKNKINR